MALLKRIGPSWTHANLSPRPCPHFSRLCGHSFQFGHGGSKSFLAKGTHAAQSQRPWKSHAPTIAKDIESPRKQDFIVRPQFNEEARFSLAAEAQASRKLANSEMNSSNVRFSSNIESWFRLNFARLVFAAFRAWTAASYFKWQGAHAHTRFSGLQSDSTRLQWATVAVLVWESNDSPGRRHCLPHISHCQSASSFTASAIAFQSSGYFDQSTGTGLPLSFLVEVLLKLVGSFVQSDRLCKKLLASTFVRFSGFPLGNVRDLSQVGYLGPDKKFAGLVSKQLFVFDSVDQFLVFAILESATCRHNSPLDSG
jgi:hypothetical protein